MALRSAISAADSPASFSVGLLVVVAPGRKAVERLPVVVADGTDLAVVARDVAVDRSVAAAVLVVD